MQKLLRSSSIESLVLQGYFENEEAVIRKAHEIYREGDNLLMLARTLRNVAVLGYENGGVVEAPPVFYFLA